MEWGGGGALPSLHTTTVTYGPYVIHTYFFIYHIFLVSLLLRAKIQQIPQMKPMNEVSVNNNNNYNDDDDDVHIHDDDDDDVNGDNDNNISYTRVKYEKINCSYYNYVT